MDEICQANDLTEMDCDYIYTDNSELEGIGIYSSKKILKGEVICPCRIGDLRTIAGRFTNHGLHASAVPCMDGEVYSMKAAKDIQVGEEITINYREVIRFQGGDLSQDG